jgi:hypothetical protein
MDGQPLQNGLEALLSPVREVSEFENWSPREVAIFESSILAFGKQFDFISSLIGTKRNTDVYAFYLEWKGTSHYRAWKNYRGLLNRNNIEL